MPLKVPIYKGNLDEFIKEMCEYADELRDGRRDTTSVTLEFSAIIFAPAGKDPKLASVGPAIRHYDNKLTRLAQTVSEIFSHYL